MSHARLVFIELRIRSHRPQPPLPILHLGLQTHTHAAICAVREALATKPTYEKPHPTRTFRHPPATHHWPLQRKRDRKPCLSLEVRRQLGLRDAVQARKDELQEVVQLTHVPLERRERERVYTRAGRPLPQKPRAPLPRLRQRKRKERTPR